MPVYILVLKNLIDWGDLNVFRLIQFQGWGKINCIRYRYSLLFLSSKIPKTLLFWFVIEYAFFTPKSIFFNFYFAI